MKANLFGAFLGYPVGHFLTWEDGSAGSRVGMVELIELLPVGEDYLVPAPRCFPSRPLC